MAQATRLARGELTAAKAKYIRGDHACPPQNGRAYEGARPFSGAVNAFSILDGLEITARTSGNRVVQDAIMGSRASIAGGETIAAPLQKSQVFPPMVISMIAVGEQTGGLDEIPTKSADFYDDEVDAAVSAFAVTA